MKKEMDNEWLDEPQRPPVRYAWTRSLVQIDPQRNATFSRPEDQNDRFGRMSSWKEDVENLLVLVRC